LARISLQQLGGNVDLVGHDWGALHVYGVMDERPDLIRSWAADCAGILHSDYIWHDLAQVWQTPSIGEESIATMFGLPKEKTLDLLTSFGIPEDIATAMAPGLNNVMGECVLSLYRYSRGLRALVDVRGRHLCCRCADPALELCTAQ